MPRKRSLLPLLAASSSLFWTTALSRAAAGKPEKPTLMATSDPLAIIRERKRAIIGDLVIIRETKDQIEKDLTEADRMLSEAEQLLAIIRQKNASTVQELKSLQSQIAMANLLLIKRQFRRQEAVTVQNFMNNAYPGFCIASPEEARFMVKKARMMAVLKKLDSRRLSEEKRKIFEEYKGAIIPQIAAAAWDSPFGQGIEAAGIPTSVAGVICEAIPIAIPATEFFLDNRISQRICEAIVDKIIEVTKEKYQGKFKNLSPLDAVECIKKAIDISIDQNTQNLLNPGLFLPNPGTNFGWGPTGLQDLFNNPHRTFDFETPFTQALDQCIEERNKQITDKINQNSSEPYGPSYRHEPRENPQKPDKPDKKEPEKKPDKPEKKPSPAPKKPEKDPIKTPSPSPTDIPRSKLCFANGREYT